LNTQIKQNGFSIISFSTIALIGLFVLGGCSQKPSSEEIAAQVKIALEEMEKAKQEAAAPAQTAPAPVAKQAPKPKPVKKAQHVEEAKPAHTAVVEKVVCFNCGVVLSVKEVLVEGKGTGMGVVAGGVAGGLLGNQVGKGDGRDLATIVGVVGGAIAGNKIEKNVKKVIVYDVLVKMENGDERVLRHTTNPDLTAGARVKVENDLAVKQ